MGADQIAVIRPMIRELEEAALGTADSGFFASFEKPGKDRVWVEVALGTINFAYPFTDDPIRRIQGIGLPSIPEVALDEWEPGKLAALTYSHTVPSRDVATFVDAIFSKLLGCGDDYLLDASIVRFSTHSGRA